MDTYAYMTMVRAPFDCEYFATYTVSQNENRPRGRRVALLCPALLHCVTAECLCCDVLGGRVHT